MGDERFGSGDLIDGRFQLTQELGSGGFGSVWAGIDRTTGRQVAVKILHEGLSEHPHVLERFQREIAVLQELDHPNIARAIAGGSDGRCHYLAMQFVEGRTLLADMVETARSGGQYSAREVAEIASGLGDALDFSHARGVVHRDLKPANVMIRRIDGRIVPNILDFGIAKIAVALQDQTTLGRRLGTLMYMSPEALRGETIDGRTDVFSMGVILFEMLTLRRLFARDDRNEPPHLGEAGSSELNTHALVMKRIAAEARPKPSTYREALDPRADAAILKALDHSARNRFPTPGAFAAALEGVLAEAAPRIQASAAAVEETLADPIPPIEPTALAPTKLLPPRPRAMLPLSIASFVLVTSAVAALYLEAVEPQEIRSEAIVVEEPADPIASPRPPPPEPPPPVPPTPPPIAPPIALPPKPRTIRAQPPPPPPARDAAIESMRAALASAEDGATVVRISRALESEAARIRDREARISIERCATMSALRAEKRDLLRCIAELEQRLLEQERR